MMKKTVSLPLNFTQASPYAAIVAMASVISVAGIVIAIELIT